jgi:hypothetical protein
MFAAHSMPDPFSGAAAYHRMAPDRTGRRASGGIVGAEPATVP